MSCDLERAAMQYAVNGYRVLPVKPGSNAPPLISGFSRSATKEPERVADLWRRFPGANPGVATGGELLIVDCDTKDAVSTVRELGVPEATPTVTTPRGGQHFYLRGHAPTRTGVQPGVDLRGTRGYAVGAGARRSDGVYEWEVAPWEVDEAAIPVELDRLIREVRRTSKTGAAPDLAGKGERNNHLMRKGAALRRASLSAESIAAALHAENAACCRPLLDEAEVERIAKSCSKMREPPYWVLDPWKYFEDERLSQRARLVLLALYRHASDDGTVRGGTWLETKTGLSRNSVSRATGELERLKFLEVIRAPKMANLYKLSLTPPTGGVLGTAPIRCSEDVSA